MFGFWSGTSVLAALVDQTKPIVNTPDLTSEN